MVTLYNVVSEDGYIADKNGTESFIPNELWPITINVIGKYDVLVMGRKTYDAIQKYPEELLKPFEELPIRKVVVTNKKNFSARPGYTIVHSPQDALAIGANTVVSSGPTLNNFLLKNGLVDVIILHKVPTKIGDGMRPFTTNLATTFAPPSETEVEGGIKELCYQVIKS